MHAPQVRRGYPEGDIHINEDLDVFDISPRGVIRRKRLVPDRSWGPWVAESNWQQQAPEQQSQGRRGEAAEGDEPRFGAMREVYKEGQPNGWLNR